MLSNTLTVDDEEVVQKELLELQEAIVSISTQSLLTQALSFFCSCPKRRRALNCPLFLLIIL